MHGGKLAPGSEEIIEEETGLGASYAGAATPDVVAAGDLAGTDEPEPASVLGLLAQAGKAW